MKATLISINSINENTGGGIYLRCLQELYTSNAVELNLICKSDNQFGYRKNIFSDILSRIVFLSPSFLALYFLKVLKQCKNSDIIAIHSSRLGFYVWLLKKIYPNKKIYIHTDNVEAKLVKDNLASGDMLKKILNRIDSILIPYSEKLCAKWSDKITFITQQDLNDFTELYKSDENKNYIVPIYLKPKSQNEIPNICRDKVIFTGSFDFYPNQEAFYTVIKISRQTPDINYVIAGRKLSDFISSENISIPNNVIIESDVEPQKLDKLYSESYIFLCPVRFGSGMKTKIAEALSYGLYVIANEQSVSGYLAAINSGVVSSKNDMNFEAEAVNAIKEFYKNVDDKYYYAALDVFNGNYNIDNGIKSFSEILLK